MSDTHESDARMTALIERLADQPQLLELVEAIVQEHASEQEDVTSTAAANAQAEAVAAMAPERPTSDGRTERRHHLLGALRPYLSERRAKALDSFEAIAGVLDFMK